METRDRRLGGRQGRWDIIIFLASGVAEIMVARKVVGPNVCASCGVGVKIRSTMTNMALPFVRICLLLMLGSSHSDCSGVSKIESSIEGDGDIGAAV